MQRFDALLNAGARVAVMSDVTDGDCGWEGAITGARNHFLAGLPIESGSWAIQRQVHGSVVRPVTRESAGLGATTPDTSPGDGDGLITREPGLALGVTVADCVPILLFDPSTGAIGALHAGRAGTVAGIATEGVLKLVSEYGVEPKNVLAVVGPSAGPCCYEVSPALRDECVQQGVIARGPYLDLWESNRRQLRGAGVQDAHITVLGECTICTTGFHSYRREQTTARNLAVIMA